MTLKQLKEIIETLPPHTIILIDSGDQYGDLETVNIEYKSSGSIEIILSNKE